MSWEPLAKYKYARATNDHDTIAVQFKDIVIRFGDDILTKMGWKEGDRLNVIRGQGEHAGMVRLHKDERGWKLYYPTGKTKFTRCSGLVLKMGRKIGGETFPKTPERLPATEIKTRIDGDAVEFRLPWMPPATADEAIKEGFPVKRGPPTTPFNGGGNPVREKARAFNGGRV